MIVATEEALAAVPSSMREGSYACGASKWQTIHRIVLPRAMPGIMTGMILAMARGAGEVAPLMLVGAVKLAPDLPIDGVFPYVHLERSFMHLGYHIYDLGFHSQNSVAAALDGVHHHAAVGRDRGTAERDGDLAAVPAAPAIRRQPFLSIGRTDRSRRGSPDHRQTTAQSVTVLDFCYRGPT